MLHCLLQLWTDAGFVDTFRAQHPGVQAFTYFNYMFKMREKNKGWRIDYFMASAALADRCHDAFVMQVTHPAINVIDFEQFSCLMFRPVVVDH